MKYIDADKLIAEIERRKEKWLAASRLIKKGKDKAMYAAGKSSAYTEFFSLITSLQQEQPQVTDTSKMEQEIDLKKEYKKYVEDDPVFSRLTNRNVGLAIARHFWNKGYNARNKK